MPIEYKSYGCQHKCGYRHNTNKKKIEKHESECFKNVDNQTCETCDFNISYNAKHDYPNVPISPVETWFVRACEHSDGADLLERNYEELKMGDFGWVKPIVHCPFHSSISDEERELQDNFWDSND